MAALLACSPVSCHASAFRSPNHHLRSEASSRSGNEELYQEAEARLTQWRKECVRATGSDAQQGLRDLAHERAHVKELQADLVSVQGLVDAASQLRVGGERLAEVLRSSVEAEGYRTQAVVLARDELRDKSAACARELQSEQRKIAKQRELAEMQQSEALKLLNTYSGRLGLSITRAAPQTVRLAFSLIDESHPEREFFLTLGLAAPGSSGPQCVGEPAAYSIGECVPELQQLPKLLAELNVNACSSTSLPRFVCGVRRAFIKVASSAQVAS